jgi:hypothetical protein
MGDQHHVGLSDLRGLKRRNGLLVCAVCIYTVGPVAVQMLYWRADELKREGLVGAWHPRQKTSKFVIAEI